jgi:hypothetical protein
VRDVYTGIDQLVITESFKASKVCDLLEVSRSGFYAWRSGQESRRGVRDRELISRISAVFGVIAGDMGPGGLRWNWHAKELRAGWRGSPDC